ncbi:MAG: DNA topoisomerase IV [Flavobacterium sp.]|nr:DNA topoisomerase IV [Flavobacterium sp.]
MKKSLFLLVLAPLFISCYQQERNCADYKTGKFKFETEIDGKTMVTVFERFDDIEIETFEGKTDTATVRWINDCEYILQKKHPKNMQERKAISMKILTTTNNSYTFEYGIVGNDSKQRGTAVKIN